MSAFEFKKDDGDFVSPNESEKLISNRHRAFKEKGRKKKEYVHSQFFGKDKLQKLIEQAGSECVGLKFNFCQSGEGDLDAGLVIQAVDKNGIVLTGSQKVANAKSPGYTALAGGPVCPITCIPPVIGDDDD